jgi:hypothetical protein
MHLIETRSCINGCLKKVDIGLLVCPDGYLMVRGHNFFLLMNLEKQPLQYPIIGQTKSGVNVEFDRLHFDDQEVIQITIDDEEPLYCDPIEFKTELMDSLGIGVV